MENAIAREPIRGEVVEYVLNTIDIRPAMVISVFRVESQSRRQFTYLCDLEVFGPSTVAGMISGKDPRHPPQVPYDNGKVAGTWHFRENGK